MLQRILWVGLLIGGLVMSSNMQQEVFPDFDLDFVTVTVAYPGASPEEVEQGIVLAVEEAVQGLDGIKEITSTAREGSGAVEIELIEVVSGESTSCEVVSGGRVSAG